MINTNENQAMKPCQYGMAVFSIVDSLAKLAILWLYFGCGMAMPCLTLPWLYSASYSLVAMARNGYVLAAKNLYYK